MNVALLMGGTSSERLVSLKSAQGVLKALRRLGYVVEAYDLRENALPKWKCRPTLAFLALHGGWGEDGGVQEALEREGIPYTGSPPQACRLAMDKVMSKHYFQKAGLSVPSQVLITSFWPYELVEKVVEEHLDFPVVVKPSQEGSSIGLSLVRRKEELKQGLKKAFSVSAEVLVEAYVEGREFTVAILEEHPLPPIEICPEGGLFDYEAKYTPGKTRYVLSPTLSLEERKGLQEAAWKAHCALGCRDFSRVDLILTPQGEFFVLEVNTLPGMTETSLLPMAAKSVGLSFEEVCQKMCQGALKRKVLAKAS